MSSQIDWFHFQLEDYIYKTKKKSYNEIAYKTICKSQKIKAKKTQNLGTVWLQNFNYAKAQVKTQINRTSTYFYLLENINII